MEDFSHDGSVDFVFWIFLESQACNIMKIEHHGAAQIHIDGCGADDVLVTLLVRQDVHLSKPIHHEVSLLGIDVANGGDLRTILDAKGTDRNVCLCKQLSQETRDLVLAVAYAVLIVDAGKVLCTLDEPIEIVCIDCYLVLDSCQMECCAQVCRNHAVLGR